MRDERASTPRILIVVTTVGTQEQALDIANHLVDRRLAACVNILPGVRSIFRWKGVVNDDTEFLLLVKTVEERFDEVAAAIKELHAYELPEILAYPAPLADGLFAGWVSDATSRADGDRGRARK
jgi:periplasmic divalent cation tolerance protein